MKKKNLSNWFPPVKIQRCLSEREENQAQKISMARKTYVHRYLRYYFKSSLKALLKEFKYF